MFKCKHKQLSNGQKFAKKKIYSEEVTIYVGWKVKSKKKKKNNGNFLYNKISSGLDTQSPAIFRSSLIVWAGAKFHLLPGTWRFRRFLLPRWIRATVRWRHTRNGTSSKWISSPGCYISFSTVLFPRHRFPGKLSSILPLLPLQKKKRKQIKKQSPEGYGELFSSCTSREFRHENRKLSVFVWRI